MWEVIINSSFYKKGIRILPFFLIALCLFLVKCFINHYEELENKVRLYESKIVDKSIDKSYIDKSGKSHYVKKLTVIGEGNLGKDVIKSDTNLQLIKDNIPIVKKSMRNLINGNVVATVTTIDREIDFINSSNRLSDTLKNIHLKFKDSTVWMKQEGEIINGKLKQHIEIYDTIVVVGYWHKKWILGRKVMDGEAVSTNPNTRVFIKEFIIRKL